MVAIGATIWLRLSGPGTQWSKRHVRIDQL